MKKIIVGVVAVVLVVAGVGIYSSNNSKKEMMVAEKNRGDDQVMMKKENGAMKAGTYEAYGVEKIAKASTGKVVLFFRAPWCPTCRAVDSDIKANLSKIPSELTILDVDYDSSTALKQKYAVTYQHTFVQVDENGNLIKKWSGSPTLSALVAEVK